MHYSHSQSAYVNGDGVPIVKVMRIRNCYIYYHPVTAEKFATTDATDDGIRWFASKFWYRPTIEIRD